MAEDISVFMLFPECKECHDHEDTPVTAAVLPDTESPAATEPLKERPVEEVTARLAQQDQEEQEILTCRLTTTATTHTLYRIIGYMINGKYFISLFLFAFF